MTLYCPEDWAAQIDAIGDWLESETSLEVIEKNQNGPSPTKSYVGTGVLAPPIPVGRSWPQSFLAVQVISLIDLDVYTVTLGVTPYSFTADADATTAEVVAGLVAAIPGAESSTAFPGVVILAGHDLETLIAVTTNLRPKRLDFRVAESEFTLSVDCYAAKQASGASPETAIPLVMPLWLSVEREDVQERLRDAGLAILEVLGVRRLPVTKNGAWEDRAGFDLRLRTLTRSGSLLDYIETVATEGVVDGYTITT